MNYKFSNVHTPHQCAVETDTAPSNEFSVSHDQQMDTEVLRL